MNYGGGHSWSGTAVDLLSVVQSVKRHSDSLSKMEFYVETGKVLS